MLISVFALLEGSVSSLLITVEKIYANAHAFDTKKKTDKTEKINMKNFPPYPFVENRVKQKKKIEDSCKKYRLLELLRFLHSRNNRIYKLDANLTSLYTI